MRENRTFGSVRGALDNGRSYREIPEPMDLSDSGYAGPGATCPAAEKSGLTNCQAPETRSACHRSWFFCKFIQRSAEVLKARDRRRAMSGVMEPRSLMILDRVFLDMPSTALNSVTVIDKGFR